MDADHPANGVPVARRSTDTRDEASLNAAAAAANDVFLRCLAERTRQQRAVSERRSPTFAPAVFAAMPEARGFSKVQLEQAMDRLFRLGRIERAVLGRDTDKGRDIVGLRLTPPNGAPERSPNTLPERPLTPAPNTPQHTPYTTYREAVPLGGDPPSLKEDETPIGDSAPPAVIVEARQERDLRKLEIADAGSVDLQSAQNDPVEGTVVPAAHRSGHDATAVGKVRAFWAQASPTVRTSLATRHKLTCDEIDRYVAGEGHLPFVKANALRSSCQAMSRQA